MILQSILDSFKGKKVIVTGGTGLIGRPVVDMLVNAGAEVYVISLDTIRPNPDAHYLRFDLREFMYAKLVTAGAYCVFHLAGIKGGVDVTKKRPATVFVPYLQFNTNVLEACRINNVQKVVYTSTIGAYKSAEVFQEEEILEGMPMDVYAGWAKRMAELQIKAYKQQYENYNFIAVRPANVYGEGDNFDPQNAMVIPSLMYRILSGENPLKVWGDGSAVRDFAYSRDVAEGIILAAYHMPDVDYLNLGSGIGYTVKELVETLQDVVSVPFQYEWDVTKPNGFPKRVMDIELAHVSIGYSPNTTLKEGLRRTWLWFIEHKDEYLQRMNYFVKE